MKYIPAKYRFFLSLPNIGEREVFPLYNPGAISFTYEKWNDYTEDFKIIANDDFIFVDSTTEGNTDTEIHKPYSFLKTYADTLIQSVDVVVKYFEGVVYKVLLNGVMKILDDNTNQFTPSQKKFIGKIETSSYHQTIESILDTEVNVLLNDATRTVATLQSESISYNHNFQFYEVISYILSATNSNILVRENPYPYIVDTVGIENLLLADKTDIKRPTATANATILKLTLSNIFKWMQSLFNLKYKITDNGELYFQHESEKSTSSFTLEDEKILNLDTFSYGYKSYNKSIDFEYEESYTAGFVAQQVVFNVNEENTDSYSASSMNNDIQFILDNNASIEEDSDNTDEVAESGVTLLACDSDLNVYESDGVINYKLQLTYLIEKCFYYTFFFNKFTINDVEVSIINDSRRKKAILSTKRTSKFDVNKLIETSIGTFEILSVEIKGDSYTITGLF